MPRVGAIAVGLVLISAMMHATWNVLAKRSADPLAFLFAISSAGLLIYAIPVGVVLAREGVSSRVVPFFLVSGTLEMAYTLFLAAAYRNGALSLTYPIARVSKNCSACCWMTLSTQGRRPNWLDSSKRFPSSPRRSECSCRWTQL